MSDPQEKLNTLRSIFQQMGSVLVAYSGGVDSAFVLAVATETLGPERVLGVTGVSESLAPYERNEAAEIAQQVGARHRELKTDELSDENYLSNPANRCYFCKSELWSVLERVRADRGIATIIDGTNADDLSDHRPGTKAAAEHGIRSPLAELGFTKGEIRELSRARGIPTWSQPSSPCLSSRLPYGTPVTVRRLSAVERAERALRDLGVAGNLRVRHHGDTGRVEMDLSELERWNRHGRAAALCDAVRGAGFENVVLDPRGYRSGSLNVRAGVITDRGDSAPLPGS